MTPFHRSRSSASWHAASPWLASVVAVAALAGMPAMAAPAGVEVGVEARLSSLASLEGDAWRVAKAEALADPAFVTALRTWTAPSASDWRRAAAAKALIAAADAPTALARLGEVKGVDPAIYLLARRPIPLAVREVTRLDLSAGTLLDAFLFEGSESFLKRPESAYPARHRGDVARLRGEEIRALEEGLLTALARTHDDVAVSALLAELGSSDPRRAELAAVLLGETGSQRAQAALTARLDDESVRGTARTAATVGLSRFRTLATVERLARDAGDQRRRSDERVAAIRGLANAGNRFAHQASPQAASESVRKAASDALVALLPAVALDAALADAVGESLATVGHPSATAPLTALAGAGQPSEVRAAASRSLRLHARSVRAR